MDISKDKEWRTRPLTKMQKKRMSRPVVDTVVRVTFCGRGTDSGFRIGKDFNISNAKSAFTSLGPIQELAPLRRCCNVKCVNVVSLDDEYRVQGHSVRMGARVGDKRKFQECGNANRPLDAAANGSGWYCSRACAQPRVDLILQCIKARDGLVLLSDKQSRQVNLDFVPGALGNKGCQCRSKETPAVSVSHCDEEILYVCAAHAFAREGHATIPEIKSIFVRAYCAADGCTKEIQQGQWFELDHRWQKSSVCSEECALRALASIGHGPSQQR